MYELTHKTPRRNKIVVFVFLLLCLIAFVVPVYASSNTEPAKGYQASSLSTNIYWIDLKKQLKAHLEKVIDSSKYKYEIVEPNRPMTNFLGNMPNAKISFSGPVLTTRTHRKTITAKSGKQSMGVTIKVWEYYDVWKLSKDVKRGMEIPKDALKRERIAILQKDKRLYYSASPDRNLALRDLDAGTAIKINMLRHAKVIQPGDNIQVVMDSQYIKIQFRCRAFNSADIGELVNISCPDLKQNSPKAIVTAPGFAELR